MSSRVSAPTLNLVCYFQPSSRLPTPSCPFAHHGPILLSHNDTIITQQPPNNARNATRRKQNQHVQSFTEKPISCSFFLIPTVPFSFLKCWAFFNPCRQRTFLSHAIRQDGIILFTCQPKVPTAAVALRSNHTHIEVSKLRGAPCSPKYSPPLPSPILQEFPGRKILYHKLAAFSFVKMITSQIPITFPPVTNGLSG